MNAKINIAIDGYSSCGKSTLTKQLSKQINYKCVDTGAMYRAVTFYFLENDIDFSNLNEVKQAISSIKLNFKQVNGETRTILNGVDVEDDIRNLRVSSSVSEVATISLVRRFLVLQQQEISKEKGIVMDGRDIGTVVLPNAELKIFMTADKDVRVERRYQELISKGQETTREEIRKNLEHRDYIDTHRQDSPLSKADDAILLDNTNLTVGEQLAYVVNLVNKKVEGI